MFPLAWGIYMGSPIKVFFLVLDILAHAAISPTVGTLRESSYLFSLNLKDFHYLWDLFASLLVETGEGFE